MKYCSKCGKEIIEEALFCQWCAAPIKEETINQEENLPQEKSAEDSQKGNAKASYFFTVISAIVTFFIRIAIQDDYIYYDNILDNKRVLGIDRDMKPIFSLIPGIALIIASLIITSDKITDKQKKLNIFVVNIVYIALSVLFIWLDIPSDIIDF